MRIRRKSVLIFCIFFTFVFMANTALALTQLPVTGLPVNGLRLGSDGEAVRILQENLIELGLYNSAADGLYNEDTVSGVRGLQNMLGLPEDGICNIQTINALNAAIKSNTLLPEASVLTEVPRPLAGKTIGIDAGHQQNEDTEYEPLAPNSKATKERMSAGAVGIKSGIPEYETNLLIAKKIKNILEDAGATVVMTRTSNDISLSNAERAAFINRSNVDVWIRVHCDYSTDRKLNGVRVLTPSAENASAIAESSLNLAKALLPAVCKTTGAKQLAVTKKADQTGFNWSKYPVVAIEFGYLSNPNEDVSLNRDYYQQLCAQGVYNGLLNYFEI